MPAPCESSAVAAGWTTHKKKSRSSDNTMEQLSLSRTMETACALTAASGGWWNALALWDPRRLHDCAHSSCSVASDNPTQHKT